MFGSGSPRNQIRKPVGSARQTTANVPPGQQMPQPVPGVQKHERKEDARVGHDAVQPSTPGPAAFQLSPSHPANSFVNRIDSIASSNGE